VTHEINRVALVGAGYMGGGIASVLAASGLDVVIADADADATRRHHERLLAEWAEFERGGLVDAGTTDQVTAHLTMAETVEEAVASVDLVEEAVPEDPDLKEQVLRRIESAARPDAVLATNTSTIPIGRLAESLHDPTRFLGVHFSNPAPFIPGVEVIAHAGTDESVIPPVEAMVARSGKLSARVNDRAGFVLNRLQFVLLKEAIDLVEEGVATAEAVDVIVRTTFGYRLGFFGPFAIADMAGLDTYRGGFATLEEHYGERLRSPQMLNALVDAGKYGVKQGGGFVTEAGDQTALVTYRNTAYARLAQLLRELGPAPLGKTEGP